MKAAKKSVRINLACSFDTFVTIANEANETITCSDLLVSYLNLRKLIETYLKFFIVTFFIWDKSLLTKAVN